MPGTLQKEERRFLKKHVSSTKRPCTDPLKLCLSTKPQSSLLVPPHESPDLPTICIVQRYGFSEQYGKLRITMAKTSPRSSLSHSSPTFGPSSLRHQCCRSRGLFSPDWPPCYVDPIILLLTHLSLSRFQEYAGGEDIELAQ